MTWIVCLKREIMFRKRHEKVYLNNNLIIKLVSEHPEIWDKNSRNYRDRDKNDEAWKDISRKVFKDWNDCSDEIKSLLEKMVLRRWSSLRDAYIKWSKKFQTQQQIGGRSTKYMYHKHLAFLEPFVNTICRSSIRKQRAKKNKPVEIEVEVEPVDDEQFVEEITTNEIPSYEDPIDVDDNQILGMTSPTVSNDQNPLNNSWDDICHEQDRNSTTKENIISKYIDLLHTMSDRMSDRHYMFFQGVLPLLKDFNEDETLEYQMNIMQCIKNIKSQRKSN